MKRSILLTGRTGQIGADLLPLLAPLGDVIAPDHREMDLRDPESVRRTIHDARPTLIVNAAAYTAVDRAETDEATACAVNSDAPAAIATEARKIGAALIHYSTDYVFDGTKGAPYVESDPTAPLNAYGRTKLAGEEAIRAAGIPHLIFRTAWVYSTRGTNFVRTILRLARERDELRIVADQAGAPTWSREIAAATAAILGKFTQGSNGQRDLERVSGTYHMTASGETTWFGFAQSIVEELAGTQSTGRSPRVVPISAAEYPTPARRPAYSVLDNRSLKRTFGYELPDWRAQMHAMFRAGNATLDAGRC